MFTAKLASLSVQLKPQVESMAANTTLTCRKVEPDNSTAAVPDSTKAEKADDSVIRVSDVWRRVERMHLSAAEAARAAVMISSAEERAPENHELAALARHVRTNAYVAIGGSLIVEQALQHQTDLELQMGGTEIGARVSEKAAKDAWTACEEALCLISVPPASSASTADCLTEHDMTLV